MRPLCRAPVTPGRRVPYGPAPPPEYKFVRLVLSQSNADITSTRLAATRVLGQFLLKTEFKLMHTKLRM